MKERKFIFFMLALLFFIFCFTIGQVDVLAAETGIVSGECGENVTWQVNPNTKTLTISGQGKMTDYDGFNNKYAPWYKYKDDIQIINVEEGVTYIGTWAFYGLLENYNDNGEINFPETTLKEIGENAFTQFGCHEFSSELNIYSLKKIIIPNSVNTIGDTAFERFCAQYIEIPGTVENFSGSLRCETEMIVFKEGIKNISLNINSSKIYLPGTVQSVEFSEGGSQKPTILYGKNDTAMQFAEDNAIFYVDATQPYIIENADFHLGSTLSDSYLTYIHDGKEIKLLEDVDYKFVENEDGSVTFTGQMIYSGEAARWANACGAEGLGNNAIWSYDNLTKTLTISGTGAMQDYENSDRVPWKSKRGMVEKIVIEEGITRAGSSAFVSLNASMISLPQSLKSIGVASFEYNNLISIDLPSELETIERYAFSSCYYIRSVKIPGSVHKIENNAFAYGNSLSLVEMEEGVSIIEENAFWRNSGMHVYCPSTLGQIGNNAFNTGDGNIISVVYGKNNVTKKYAQNNAVEYIDASNTYDILLGEVDDSYNWNYQKVDGRYVYSGEKIEPNLNLYFTHNEKKIELINNVDYEVRYINSDKPGVAKAVIKGLGVYSGEKEWNYSIVIPMDKVKVSLSQDNYIYDKTAKTPSVVVSYLNKTLEKDVDYTVSYKNNIESGTASVEINGVGNGYGKQSVNYTITKQNIQNAQIALSQTEYIYDGTEKKPEVVVKMDNKELKENVDYKIAYGEQTMAGDTMVTITGMDLYEGTKTVNYVINPYSIENAEVKLKETIYSYDGSPKTPSVEVKLEGKALVENQDYVLTYKNNTDDGTAYAVITGTGNYKDTVEMSFVILPYNAGMDSVYEEGALIDGNFVYGITDDEKNEVEACCPAVKNISKVQIPATVTCDGVVYKVTSIGQKAFYKNTKITSLTIGNNVKSIEDYAFYGCKNMKTLKIGSGVEIMGNSAFRKCTKLTSIVLPKSMNELGKNAFYGCSKLKTITINSNSVVDVSSNAIKGISKKAVIKVPKKLVSKYKKEFKKSTGFIGTMKIKKK